MRSVRLRTRRTILSASITAVLSLVSTVQSQNLHWDAGADGDSLLGGTGTWNLGNPFWDPLGGDAVVNNVAWPNTGAEVAVFGGTAGTVTVSNGGLGVSAAGLVFNSGGYVLASDIVNLTGATPSITVTNGTDTVRISSVLAGANGFTASGNGTLLLSGTNTLSGQITIGSGTTVVAASGGALGNTVAGNETVVSAGGTLNLGGQNMGAERFQISGTGVNGIGALINQGASQINATQFVALTGNATVRPGGLLPGSFNAGGLSVGAGTIGRFDVRAAAYAAGALNLHLNGNTLTKVGNAQMSLVNADVSAGNIIVNEGVFSVETNSVLNGLGNIAVNPNGKLAFWGLTNNGVNVAWPVLLNGGTIGEVIGSSANQTVVAPVTITGSLSPNFVSNSNTTTMTGPITEDGGSTVTEVAKRGSAILVFANPANAFDAQVSVYSGTLRANYTTTLGAGGVPPNPPLTSSDTPLGTHSTIRIAGGTLSLRVNMADNNTNQRWLLNRNILVDLAPGLMDFDRLSNAAQTDKYVVVDSLVFAPASAANGYSIGQNQLTFTQGNTHRLEVTSVTMNSDTVLAVGDFNLPGDVLSPGRNSLAHTAGSSWGFTGTGGAHEFNALFNVGTGNLRVGSMFGTPVTSNTITAGSGPIYVAPSNGATFRSPTNIAAGQTIEAVSQRLTQSIVNFEQATSIPPAFRALTSGVIGVGGSTAFGDIDLSRLGDGTFRIGAGLAGAGNGTIVGQVLPGTDRVVRVGAFGTMTISGTNRVTGDASLSVGSDLIHGGFRTTTNGGAQNGTVIVDGANSFTGGTVVNRASTLNLQALNAAGPGAIDLFGTLTLSGANGTLVSGVSNTNVVNIYGGSTINLDNAGLAAGTVVDRWENSTPIDLRSSGLTYSSPNPGTYNLIETVGPLSFTGGSVITMNRNGTTVAGQQITLALGGLTRNGPATLELVRNGGNGAGFGNGQILTTAGAPAPVNGMVSPYFVINGVTELSTFATYGANGFTAIVVPQTVAVPNQFDAVVNTATFNPGLLAGTEKVYADFATGVTTATLADNPIIYALKVGAGTAGTTIASSGANNTITLRSGGLLFSGDTSTTGAVIPSFSTTAGTATIQPNLVFNDGAANIEAVVYARTGYTGVLNGTITAAGFTKFGAGTINVTTNNSATVTGTVSVNQGTLQLFGPTTTNTAYSPLGIGGIVFAGGQLNLRSNNSAVTGTINTTFKHGLTVAEGIPLAVLDVNRSAADTASSGTFIFQAGTAIGDQLPGLRMLGSPGEQGQTLTLSGANYNVTFGTGSANLVTGNTTFNIINTRTLQLDAAPVIAGTAPTITKSGDGTLIWGRAAGMANVPVGTTVVINGGALDPRSLLAFGTITQTRFVLNGGQINLKRDSSAIWSGNVVASGPGYNVTVNGNSGLNVAPVTAGTTINNFRLGLGIFTFNGNPTFTTSNTNGFIAEIQGAVLNGLPSFSSAIGSVDQETSFRISGLISGGGFVKTNTGHLHLTGINNTYDGGTYVNQGILRARVPGTLGTGPVYVNPGATIDFNSSANLRLDQPLTVRSNQQAIPMISVNTDFAHPLADATHAPVGIIGLSNTINGFYNTPIDLAAMYGGGWHLGGISTGAYDGRYTAPTLGAGAGNTYRLGGGGLTFLVGLDGSNNPNNNLFTGANSVMVGFDAGNMRTNATTFQVAIGGTHDYTGSTIVHRGTVATLVEANNGAQSGFSNSAVALFGNLVLRSNASLALAGGTSTNALTLHPGSALHLDSLNGTGNSTGTGVVTTGSLAVANQLDRLGDNTPLILDGALLDLIGNAAGTTETVGAVSYGRGARIRVARNTVASTLTLSSLTASGGNGHTLLLQPGTAGQLGVSENIIVNTGAPVPVNGMVSPSIVNLTDHTFVTYNGGTGFGNITYDDTVNATYVAGALQPTDKVDVVTAALNLQDNPTVYALRTSQAINIAGGNTTITLRSGGFISAPPGTTSITVQPNLVFHNGTVPIEARIYASANTLTLTGALTANGITKFGNGILAINMPQPGYTGGWTVNGGALQINDPRGLGDSVASNTITLNGVQTTAGSVSQAITQTQLTLNRDNGTPEPVIFSGGTITVINEATLRLAATNDRTVQSPPVVLQSTGASSVGFTLDVPNNRFVGIVPKLTLNSDAFVRVHDSGNTTDTGRITAALVPSLAGNDVDLIKTGNRTLELSGDNTTTWTNSRIHVAQGTLRVTHNGALGNAASVTTVERNSTLEIGVANFSPAATVAQQPGSIERWNVENARGSGNYNLPAGVNLQLNTNLSTPRTIGLNGGSVEGFLWIDHPAPAVQRTIGSAVTLHLLADSSVGQNILQGLNYDLGRQPTVTGPFTDNVTGAFLRIDGNITGAFNLTKTGLDTVVLAGAANTYKDTIVDMGVLRIGAANVLPAAGALVTRYAGTFDLFGFDQTVGGLGTVNGGPNPGAVSVGSSGRIVNSGAALNTLTSNHTGDYTYNGSLEMNVSLTKAGPGLLVLGNPASTYRGVTTVGGGVLQIESLANGSVESSIGASSSAAANLVFSGGGVLRYNGGLPANTDRLLTLGDGGGGIEANGGVTFASAAPIQHVGTAPRTLILGGTSGGGVFAPVITDGAAPTSLRKTGGGTWLLSGLNTHTGATTIEEGTLILAGSVTASTTLDIRSNALLDATTVIGGVPVTPAQTLTGEGVVLGDISVFGTVNPGNPSGTLLITGLAAFNTGSLLSLDLPSAADYDRLSSTGATLAGTVNLSISLTYVPTPFVDSFVILENGSAQPVSGLFTWGGPEGVLSEGELFHVNGTPFTITYAGGAGNNDVILSVVPEPGTAALLLGGLALLTTRRRRQTARESR